MGDTHDAGREALPPTPEMTPGEDAAPANRVPASGDGAPLGYAEVSPAAPEPLHASAGVPEDLRVGWTWLDLGILIVVGVGCTLIATQFTAALVVSFTGVNPRELGNNPLALSVFTAISQAVISLLVLVYLMVQVRVRVGTPFWSTLGFRPFALAQKTNLSSYGTVFLSGMGLAIAVAVIGSFVRTQKELPIQQHFKTVEGMALLGALAVLIAPLFEETIFRGYLYPVMARSCGVPAGVLGTGLLFGLVHAMQLWGGWGEILLLILVGIVFTYARAATGSVLASFLLHLGYNSMLVLAQFAATGGFRYMPGTP